MLKFPFSNRSKVIQHKFNNARFNRELRRGVLPSRIFKKFAILDCLYLDFQKDLFLKMANLNDCSPSNSDFYKIFATRVISSEKSKLIKQINIDVKITPKNQKLSEYMMHLNSSLDQGEAIAISSAFACFDLYYHFGNQLSKEELKNNKYKFWLAGYQKSSFQSVHRRIAEIINQYYLYSNNDNKKLMDNHYYISGIYEVGFLESLYQTEILYKPKLSEQSNEKIRKN